jgi:ABC-type nitrate/sulfonate/bicarbonate transport system permease component
MTMQVDARDVTAIAPGTERDDRARAQKVAAARRQRQFLLNVAIRLVSLTAVLGLWEYFGATMDPGLFTTPLAIAKAAVVMIGSGELWNYLAPSLVVLAFGLTLAAVVGIVVGLLLARFWMLDVAFGVYITFLYSIPSVALVPVIVLWAGFETGAKVIILFLFAFFPMAINTYQGVKNVDHKLIEVGRSFRCSEWQLWKNIVLPGALPFIVTGLRLAVGRGLIGMVLADRAHRQHLPGRQNVCANRDARPDRRYADGLPAVRRIARRAVDGGRQPGLR